MFKFLSKINATAFLFLLIFSKRFNLFFSKSIIIPFEEYLLFSRNSNISLENFKYDKYKFIQESLSIKFISMLKIGTPEKIIPSVFNIRETSLYIAPNEEYRLISFNKTFYNCYNPLQSNTFKNCSANKNTLHYRQYYLINETIKLYNNVKLKNLETINDFQIYLKDNLNNAFSYIDISNKNNIFIINQLKEKKIINDSILSIHYTSDSKGYISIGEYPHIYDNEHYFKEQLILFNFETTNGKYYDILTNKIYVAWNENNDEQSKKEKKINFQNVISFHHNLNVIIASEEYMNLVKDIFFNEYIKKKICNSEIVPMLGRVYLIYSCNKVNELNLEKFPTLNFNFYESKSIFTLNYKELFLEINNIYYFLVVCDYHIDENWKLGKPFLKKYEFVFDGTKKLAGYYDNIIKINNKKISISPKNKIIIIFIISNIILIPLFYYLAKRIYIKRKLNAKELNYFYEDISNLKSSLNIEKNFSK